ncbi:uncharacterized protein LOC130991713 [Salvia miltiorrhiza]|uniref:uncharacterized protein LOC130991713 n=1 Tax=Salvia miltiorrhiza TaxID=226208 RepID=UPI0025ACFB77|nr:uncharacterized protein LOC130991713 [Salvia miltiorrhiza]
MILEVSQCNLKAEAELRIWAPNLSSLEISGLVCCSCLLYVPSLTTATLSFKDLSGEFGEIDREDMAPLEMFHQVFRSIRHVENVFLSDWSIQFLVDMKANDMLVQFPNAEFLELEFYSYRVPVILAVLGMFPKLKMLIVRQYDYMYESVASEMVSLSPSLLHLETVKIYIHDKEFSISPLVEYVLENAEVLEEMVLQPYLLLPYGEENNKEAFILDLKKLLGMWRSSPYAKLIVNEVMVE